MTYFILQNTTTKKFTIKKGDKVLATEIERLESARAIIKRDHVYNGSDVLVENWSDVTDGDGQRHFLNWI